MCLGRARHPRRVVGLVAHGMNDDLGRRGLIKNDVRVGRCRQAADSGIIRAGANVGMKQKKVDNSLNTSLNALGSLG